MMIESELPKRYHLTPKDYHRHDFEHGRKTLLVLLKEIGAAWQSISQPKPRGWLSPPIENTANAYKQAMKAVPEIAAIVKKKQISEAAKVLTNAQREIQRELIRLPDESCS